VFIDDSFSIAAQRNVVLARLQRSLRLGSEDRMAVVSFDGRRLSLLSDWTGDAEALRRTLEQAQGRRSWGVAKVAAPRTSAFGEMDLRTLEETADATAAASAAMRGLTPPPGRKVLLLLSGGWPTVSALNEQGIRSDQLPSVGDDERFEKMFEPLTGTANLLGYTVYPVDVPGVESTGPDASDFRPSGGGLSSARELSVQANLEYIARQTGGVAMVNSTRLEAFDRVERDVRSYYSMGFSPEWRSDGRHHQIRVEVRRPGLKVRARDGFTDLSPRMEASLRSREALWGE
jgi:VWFA-related protein